MFSALVTSYRFLRNAAVLESLQVTCVISMQIHMKCSCRFADMKNHTDSCAASILFFCAFHVTDEWGLASFQWCCSRCEEDSILLWSGTKSTRRHFSWAYVSMVRREFLLFPQRRRQPFECARMYIWCSLEEQVGEGSIVRDIVLGHYC